MALLRYTLLRLLLFAVVAALCWVFGLRGFGLLLMAVLVSGILSIFVLSRSRDAVSTSLADRMSTIKDRMAERTAAEDAWDDAHRGDDERRREAPGDAADRDQS